MRDAKTCREPLIALTMILSRVIAKPSHSRTRFGINYLIICEIENSDKTGRINFRLRKSIRNRSLSYVKTREFSVFLSRAKSRGTIVWNSEPSGKIFHRGNMNELCKQIDNCRRGRSKKFTADHQTVMRTERVGTSLEVELVGD